MKAKLILAASALILCVFPAMSLADWDPGDSALFVQLPDLSTNGMDVFDGVPPGGGFNVPIADDFMVNTDQKLLDLHFWGSWLNDVVPIYGPQNITFDFFIYGDLPAYTGGKPYSRPDNNLLWSKYGVSATSLRQYATDLDEGWYAPNKDGGSYLPHGDTICWQYNFLFNPQEAFNLEADKVYWLLIWSSPGEAAPMEATPLFGWKTSYQHWNDAAVFRDGSETPIPQWRRLPYPDDSQTYIDLAFVITPEPATMLLLSLGGLLLRKRK